MVFNQRLRLLLKISSGIRLVVGYNNSSKRSSIQVAFNQRLRLFVKVQGSLFRWRSTKGCVSSSRSPPAFGWLSVITTAAKGPLFKWRQTKGFVSLSRSEARFRNSSKRSSIQVESNQRPKVASPLQDPLRHSVGCRF